MTKKITSYVYSEQKFPTLKTYGKVRETNKDGYLFSKGKYLTKIKVEDLPESYVEGTYYRTKGYLNAAGVKQMVYVPNMWINHMFKDDYLYVSYDKEIIEKVGTFGGKDYDGYDIVIRGFNIISFLKAAEKYSNYDISEIKEQIELKRKTFKEKHPMFYELEVTNEDFFGDRS